MKSELLTMTIGRLCMGMLLLLIPMCGYSYISDSLFYSKAQSAFQKVSSIPSETVYLHTDKSSYLPGDTIWMEAYLVDAVSHLPTSRSRYVYVELINRKDYIIRRVKLEKKTDNTIPGIMAVPVDLEEGDYYLRAYTQWMRNSAQDFFFFKNIRLLKRKDKDVQISIRYEQDGDDRFATVSFRRGYEFMKGCSVNYMIRTKKTGNPFILKQTNEYGEVRFSIPQKKDFEQYIYVILEDKHGVKYKRTFFVPSPFDYHVDFFPEGGELVSGCTQKIAFRAQANDGLSIPVSGFILNQEGDTLTSFRSEYGGIGTFILNTYQNDRYTAVVTCTHNNETFSKSFSLPQVKTDVFALHVTTHKNKAYYRILSSSGNTGKHFFLLGHMRGQLLFANSVGQGQGMINLSEIPDGILSLTLVDDGMIPYSERLLFVLNSQTDCGITSSCKYENDQRPVDVDLSLCNVDGSTLQGLYSVSVTDDRLVVADSTENNILSQLLMVSDLHGYVESPGYYFKDGEVRNAVLIDNLMLTHGWTRFRVADIIQDKTERPLHYIEAGQAISGKVVTGTNKPSANSQVLIRVNGKIYPPVQTDKNGAFALNNISFQDTSFVEAFVPEKSKLLRSKISIDRDDFPDAANRNRYREDNVIPENATKVGSEYSKKDADGTWEYSLPELVVVARSQVKERFSSYKLNDEEMIRQQDARTALDLVQRVPGFQVINNRPYLNPNMSLRPEMRMSTDVNNRNLPSPTKKINYGRTVRFMLDNRSVSYNDLPLISADDIISVHKIDPEVDGALGYAQNHKAMEEAYLEALENGADLEELDQLEFPQQFRNMKDGEMRTSGGCIILTSRKGNMRLPKNDSRGDEAFLMGINKYKEFYVPKYTVTKEHDSHLVKIPTVYWDPKLDIDQSGHATLRFYSAGSDCSYTLRLEGVTSEGLPCHYLWKINVK